MVRHLSARVAFAACFLAAVLMAGCSDDDDPPTQPTPSSVSGNSNKAPIVGASITIHQLNANTSVGGFVAGPYTTNTNGNWSGAIPAGTSGTLAMISTGGSYTDEATGNVITLSATDTLYGVLQGTSSAVTPLTHATFLGIRALVAGGMPLATAITQAMNASTTAFGFNFSTTIPDSTGTTSASQYADLLGGLSLLVNSNPALSAFAATPPFDLVIALSTDMADGKLDGLDPSGAAIQVPTDATGTTTAPLPALSASDLSAWLTQANLYAGSAVFNVNVVWNPSSTGGGVGNYGSVDYTTAGTPYPSGTATPDSTRTVGLTWQWFDRPNQIEIRIVLANQTSYPGKVETVYFIANSGAYLWTAHGVSGVEGVAVAGSTTTFTDVLLVDLGAGTTSARLTGTLTNP